MNSSSGESIVPSGDQPEVDEQQRLAELEERAPYLHPPGPSPVANRVRTLKSSVFSVAERRARLPQQLFWSLFRNEIDEIKRYKARRRILDILS